MLSWSSFLGITTLIFFINLLLAVVLVLFEKRNPISTLVWLMVILFIPVLGFVLYLFLGQDLRKRKLFFLKADEEAKLLNALKKQKELIRQRKFPFHEEETQKYSEMIYHHLLSSNAAYTQDNEIQVFHDGKALFADLKNSMKNARRFIHLEYYIIRNDNLGREVIKILSEKARQGVEVKFLYDGMGCIRVPENFFEPLLKAGGKTAVFFPPFLPFVNLRVNYRNHRKICVIDGEYGFVGGFNIGDEYLGLSKKFGCWKDMHLKITGSALEQLEARFLLDWRFASGEEIDFNKLYFPQAISRGKTGVQIVASGPDSRWPSIRSGYLKIINSAVDHVYIETPYFIPDNNILNAMKIAALSGVDIRIIIPGKSDHPLVYWASLSYIGELLEAGVRFYTYRKGFVHSKMITADGFVSTVGTANVDIRSFKVNFEVNAFVYSGLIAQELEKYFMEDMAESIELTMDIYIQRPTFTKAKEAVARLLSPLL